MMHSMTEHVCKLVLDKVDEIRLTGKEPSYIIVDHDSYYYLQESKQFIPSYMQKDLKLGDTIFGVRVASVRGGKPFLDVI